MDTDEVMRVLDERRQSFEACTSSDALASPVNPDKFYRFVSNIVDIDASKPHEITVVFEEPVPGATTLDTEYTYAVSVTSGDNPESHNRCKMPRNDLITLHQVSIVIWAMINGLLGEPE